MPTAAKAHDAQFLRTRKMATFLPVVGVPFMAVMFFLGGGGQGTLVAAQDVESGFNTDLPEAEQATIVASKLEAYASPVDSMRNRGLINPQLDTSSGGGLSYGIQADGTAGPNGSVDKSVAAAQAQLIAAQQAQLNGGGAGNVSAAAQTAPGALSPQERMELMRSEHQRELADARAQAQMAALLAQSNAAGGGGAGAAAAGARTVAAAPVRQKPATRLRAIDEDAVVSRLGSNGAGRRRTASFQGLDEGSSPAARDNTLAAVIHESQEVVSGSLVKMRLTEPALVNGHRLPANTFIYGKCSLAGERLSIAIETLKSGNSVFAAALEVYDVDGLQGLHIPGAITRDAAKQAGASSLDAADMMSLSADPAMAAAGVAVSAAKNLGKNKIRLVKVRLKAGYNIMLKVDKE